LVRSPGTENQSQQRAEQQKYPSGLWAKENHAPSFFILYELGRREFIC